MCMLCGGSVVLSVYRVYQCLYSLCVLVVVNVKGWTCRGIAQLNNWVDGSVREKFLYCICKDCDVGG